MSKNILEALGGIDVALGGQKDDALNIIQALDQISDGVGALKTSVDDINSMEIQILNSGEYNSETGVPTVENPVKGTFYLTPAKNEEDNNMFNEYYINDDGEWEMFGSASIDVNSLFDLSDRMAKGIDDNDNIVTGAIIEGNLNNKASGYISHAEGNNTIASGDYSHAEGVSTTASGNYSHTEGGGTIASGNYSHASGYYTVASGDYSHASGFYTVASGDGSYTEGNYTNTSGSNLTYYQMQLTGQANTLTYTYDILRLQVGNQYFINNKLVTVTALDTTNKTVTVNETLNTINWTNYTVTVIKANVASKINAHAEGQGTVASGINSHAEGEWTTASGRQSHAEGSATTASGGYSHAEGYDTTSSGARSHAEGYDTTSSGQDSHAEGNSTTASGMFSHAEGGSTVASGGNSHAEGSGGTFTLNNVQYTSGAKGSSSHSEGYRTVAEGQADHTEGYQTRTASNTQPGNHAEGYQTAAIGGASHAEGQITKASGAQSHAEGFNTTAFGGQSHAEGASTTASGTQSHAEGGATTASGGNSHAEGSGTTASGSQSHVEGLGTTANHAYQHVFGEYNIVDPSTAAATARGNYVEIVGNGTSSSEKSNARTLDWSGNEVLAGKLTVGVGPTENMDVATKQYVDQHSSSGGLQNLVDGSATGSVRGVNTTAENDYYTMGQSAVAEGSNTRAPGKSSHAEGHSSVAFGKMSHAEGNNASASGDYSHAEGLYTRASGTNSHAGGYNIVANHKSQYAFGEYNIEDPSIAQATERGTYVEIIGNGTSPSTKSNARTLDWSGNESLAGSLTLGLGTANQTTITAAQLSSLISLIGIESEVF